MKNILLFLAYLISVSILAQTGPGGVGNSSTNVIWLDPDIVTYSSVPSVTTWPDQSGNGNDFTQATASRQPQRVTYSGHDALRFDGGDWVRNGGAAGLNATNHTQYIVYNGNQANHTGILYDGSFTQSSQFYRTYRTSSGFLQAWVVNGSSGTEKNTVANNSAFQIISSYWDGGAETWTSYKNGTSFGTQVGADGNPTGNYRNTIGAASNNAYPFDGDIGEVIMYNVTLNSAQRNIIDNYLSSKYSVAISNDMYAYDASHQYELIGIGEEADGSNLMAKGAGIMELSIGSLSSGDYVLVGHDNTNLSSTTNDVPAVITGGSRLTRTWRSDLTGSPGNVDIVYDVSTLTLPPGSYYLLVESNNGVFNDGDVVTYGPETPVGNLVAFSGVILVDADYITLASGAGASIVSVQTGDWDDPTTWNCSCIPGASDDVSVTAGHTVSATTTTNVHDLIVNGTLNTLSTGNFDIEGDYTINASGDATHKTVTFNGSSAQSINNSSSNTIKFKNLYVNNGNGVSFQSGAFSVSGSISVSNGPLQNTGATVTVLSTASSTAVITNGAGGFSGEFVFQRYISARNANWGDLSSPVSNATLGDWDSDQSGTVSELFMAGVNGIDGDAGGFESVYRYDEVGQSYVAVTDTGYALTPGEGLEVWLGDDMTTWNAKTFDTHGTPNYGDVPVSVADSWNLVGNPYQAWINWSLLSKPTLNATFYIWNTNNGTYDAYTNGVVAPHQGFWVESVGSGTLTFQESAKTGSGSSTFKRNEFDFVEAILRVKSTTTTYAHELKLRINEMANETLDEFDASFKPSRIAEAPSITAFASESTKKLAINSFHFQDEIIIPLSIEVGVSGKYLLQPVNFDGYSNYYETIELKDNLTGYKYNLEEVNKEGITVDIDRTENSDNRFYLKLSNLSLSTSNKLLVDEDVNVYMSNEQMVITFDDADENYEISIYNTVGQKIMNNKYSQGRTRVVISNDELQKGINIVTVKSSKGIVAKKINY
ncbi:MAG: hypothetical protein J5I47_06010 [Vicingus serpentipes]|nr:hypothetical protein [Vicingus serpentipes]